MKFTLMLPAVLTSLLGLSAALSHNQPCKVDNECDATKFLRCGKIPFEISKKCLCIQGTVWQGSECRLKDGARCEQDALTDSSKPLCMDGYSCGTGADEDTDEQMYLCKIDPTAVNVRKTGTTGGTGNEIVPPESVGAAAKEAASSVASGAAPGWKEEGEGGDQGLEVEPEPTELKPSPGLRPMGRGLMKPRSGDGGSSSSSTTTAPPAPAASSDTGVGAKPTTTTPSKTTKSTPPKTPAAPAPAASTGSGDNQPVNFETSFKCPPKEPWCVRGDIVFGTMPGKADAAFKAKFDELYGNFAVNLKTLSSTVALVALMAGTFLIL